MTRALPRSAWTDTRAASPAMLDPDVVAGLAVHWMGPPVPASVYRGDKDAVARYLEAIRRFHTFTRGWSDLAYQQLVDTEGRRWTGRGWRRQSAANGALWPNRRYGAVAFLIGEGQQPTEAMLAAGVEAVAEFRALYPHARTVKTHAQVRPDPTACPGPDLTRWVRLDRYERTDDMPSTDELIAALAKELRDDDSPLAKGVRRQARLATDAELDQRAADEAADAPTS